MAEAGINTMLICAGNARAIAGACPHCSGAYRAVLHVGPCPRVEAIEYYENGATKRVVLRPMDDPSHDAGEASGH